MNEYLVPMGIILLLILLNGLFVAAEFAIVAAPRTRLTQAAARGNRTAREVLDILADPIKQNRYLATTQIGVTIASLGLGMYGEHTVATWLLQPLERFTPLAEPLAHTIATVLAIGLLTYLHVVLGEMAPKSLALQNAETAVLRLDPPMSLLRKLFAPLVLTLYASSNGIARLLGVRPPTPQARLFSPDELEYLMEESAEVGLIEPAEQLFIENIFDLRKRTVSQVMTPRKQIVALPISASEQETQDLICEQRHSRYPVYNRSLDDIVGVLHVKNFARQQANRNQQPFDLGQLSRPAPFVPESLPLDDMLTRFRRERQQMAIVVDEYGGAAGLVTLEDIIEEVVGEILDEFDREIPPLETLADGALRVRGNLLVDELNQLCHLDLVHPEVDTVGGLLMSTLGRMAHEGDRVTVDNVSFQVESVEGLTVKTVLVRLP